MFTGLIEQVGAVIKQEVSSHGVRLILKAIIDTPIIGESIAINGVCLTLVAADEAQVAFDISPETMQVTALGDLKVGDIVHLERSLKLSDRLGGHYVSGHVDTTGTVTVQRPIGEYLEVTIGGFELEDMRYFCPKGSVAIDGVSLTINQVAQDSFTVMLIPHTLEKTALSDWMIGRRVNIEFDTIARIVVHQLGSMQDSTIMALSKSPIEGKEDLV